MSYILLILCLLLSPLAVRAQRVEFAHRSWNFGMIREDGGEVSHTFTFKNNSSSPVVITDITTTCGCTTPRYSKRPILSGEESTIEIVYDPMYRPGVFSREVKIYTSADKEPAILTISGEATPRRRSVQESHPYLIGEGVRITALYGYLQHVSARAPRSASFDIINTSSQSRSIEVRSEFASKYLIIDAPTTLEAGQSGAINVTYAIPQGECFYGELKDDLIVFVDGKRSEMEIQIKAYGVDDFTGILKKGGARAEFSEKIINFESFSINNGSEVKSFTIKNLGQEPLFIRSIQAPVGVVIDDLMSEPILPRESRELSVRVEARGGEMGDFIRYATLVLNDAEHPVVRLKIVGRGER